MFVLRFKQYLHGNRGSKLVSNLIKNQRNKSFIQAIKSASGPRLINTPAIAQEFCSFYSNLYNLPIPLTSQQIETCTSEFLSSINIPRISEVDIHQLLQPFTTEEVEKVLMSIPSGRSPGPDGFPSSYYKKYKDILVPHFVTACNLLLTGGSLTPQA